MSKVGSERYSVHVRIVGFRFMLPSILFMLRPFIVFIGAAGAVFALREGSVCWRSEEELLV